VEKNRDVEAEKDCKAGKDADAVAAEAPQFSSPENLPPPPIVEGCSPTCTLLIAIAITRREKKKTPNKHYSPAILSPSKIKIWDKRNTKPNTPRKQKTAKKKQESSQERERERERENLLRERATKSVRRVLGFPR
jgi:hypothetical protein